MYAKISNDFINTALDYTKFNSNIAVDTYYSNARKGGSQFLLIKDLEYFWSVHLKDIFTIRPFVRYAIFTGAGLVTPHIDGANDAVALNFYLKVGNDATVFYKKNDPNLQPYPNTNSYDVKQLTEIGRFYANQFDTYLIDVKTIHGIEKSNDEDRIMISYRWRRHTFDEIYDSLATDKIRLSGV